MSTGLLVGMGKNGGDLSLIWRGLTDGSRYFLRQDNTAPPPVLSRAALRFVDIVSQLSSKAFQRALLPRLVRTNSKYFGYSHLILSLLRTNQTSCGGRTPLTIPDTGGRIHNKLPPIRTAYIKCFLQKSSVQPTVSRQATGPPYLVSNGDPRVRSWGGAWQLQDKVFALSQL